MSHVEPSPGPRCVGLGSGLAGTGLDWTGRVESSAYTAAGAGRRASRLLAGDGASRVAVEQPPSRERESRESRVGRRRRDREGERGGRERERERGGGGGKEWEEKQSRRRPNWTGEDLRVKKIEWVPGLNDGQNSVVAEGVPEEEASSLGFVFTV